MRRFLCLESTAGFRAGSIYIDDDGYVMGSNAWFVYTRDILAGIDKRFKEVSFNLYYEQITP